MRITSTSKSEIFRHSGLFLAPSSLSRARIFKRLWSPGINSKAPIPPAYVAWRAGTITPFPTRCLAPIDFLKIPALDPNNSGFCIPSSGSQNPVPKRTGISLHAHRDLERWKNTHLITYKPAFTCRGILWWNLMCRLRFWRVKTSSLSQSRQVW